MERSSSKKLETLKLLTTDWELNSCGGTQTHSKSSLGLKPTWVGLKPSQISGNRTHMDGTQTQSKPALPGFRS